MGGAVAACSTGVWTDNSDRAAKHRLRAVDRGALLRRLATLPIKSWSYRKDSRATRHIGPVAQDFARVFGVGQDERHLAALDANGVALAAIQALTARVMELELDLERLEEGRTK